MTKKIALFASGLLFGSWGLKLLSSKDAKKAYIHITAAGLRVKDSVMASATTLQENVSDIVASARELNATKVAEEAKDTQEAKIDGEDE